jgi:hypothetical protein
MHHGQRKANRYCGINCVATLAHDCGTGARSLRVRAGNHGVARPNRLKALGAERQSGQQQAGEKQRGGTAEIVQHMPPETF